MELVKITQVRSNENNPRFIKDYKFKKLVTSIKEFPEMLKLRPIVVNSDMVVLGGNMRLKACKEAGLKEVWVLKAEELTEAQQREFIVKDNVGFGEWDWDLLANEWDNTQLGEWGLDVLQFEESYDEEKLSENDNFFEKNEVVINLSMPYYQYEKMEDDFQNFIKKYPNIICKIQN
jgi:ParB-like chromosome segregation protein Spo0J